MIIVIAPNHLLTCNQCNKRKTVLQAKHNDLFHPLCHCIHIGSSDSMGIKKQLVQVSSQCVSASKCFELRVNAGLKALHITHLCRLLPIVF